MLQLCAKFGLMWSKQRNYRSLGKEMRKPISFRNFFKTTGLVLAGLVFLGSIEFSTSAGSTEIRTALHAANLAQNLVVGDDIFGETEEERDFDARVFLFLLTQIVVLPEPCPGTYLSASDHAAVLQSYSITLTNPRGPPAI